MSWREEMRHPATILSIVFGVLGILASLYFYIKSEKVGRISMNVDQVQAFDSSRLGNSPLWVLGPFAKQITQNIYVAVVTIWNSGDTKITPDDVRRSYYLRVNNGTVIPLDIAAVKYSSENMDGFEVQSNGQITWKNFDPGEAVQIRIVYTNDSKLPITLIGAAPGVRTTFAESTAIEELRNMSQILLFMSTYIITIISLSYLALCNIRNYFIISRTNGRLIIAFIATSAVVAYVFLWVREISPILIPHAPPI
jgi:hypothetical protein